MTRFLVVANPKADRGRTAASIPGLESALKAAQLSFDIHLTTAPLDAISAVRDAPNDYEAFIAVGGDGTVNEVANGIVQRGRGKLGLLPRGSGNDFARMIAMPRDTGEAIKIWSSRKTRTIDVGRIESQSISGRELERFFVNSVGMGIDAQVAYESSRISAVNGFSAYMVAALKCIFSYQPRRSQLLLGNDSSEGNHVLVAVGNGKSAGGGFLLTPDAVPDDGLLDVCWVKDVSKLRILRIFPTVLKGQHLRFPEVHIARGKAVSVKSEFGMPVHLDGEVIGLQETSMSISLLPKSLEVMAP